MRATRWLALPALALVLSACSTSSQGNIGDATPAEDNAISAAAPSEILAQAKKNAMAQSSFHIKGVGQCPDSSFTVDMKLRSDEFGVGTVRLGSDSLELVTTPDGVYVRAPKAFWAAQKSGAVATTIGDHWVKFAKASNPCLTALGSFSTVIANYLGYTETPTKQVGGAVFTVPAVQLQFSASASVWVASRGVPLPVEVDDTSISTQISLGEWGAVVSVTAPLPTDVIEASTLPSK